VVRKSRNRWLINPEQAKTIVRNEMLRLKWKNFWKRTLNGFLEARYSNTRTVKNPKKNE
jgi:hypothetical protein